MALYLRPRFSSTVFDQLTIQPFLVLARSQLPVGAITSVTALNSKEQLLTTASLNTLSALFAPAVAA